MLTLTIKDGSPCEGYITDGVNIHPISLDDFELEQEEFWTSFHGEILNTDYNYWDLNFTMK